MRYLVDERNTDEKESFALYRSALHWAFKRCDRFVINLRPADYDDPHDVARLRDLGQAVSSSSAGNRANSFPISAGTIQVTGVPDEQFLVRLTEQSAPARATAGDTCPVEQVILLVGERRLYGCYDYGRTQVLDLTDDELQSLRQALEASGLKPELLIPAPPYLTDFQK